MNKTDKNTTSTTSATNTSNIVNIKTSKSSTEILAEALGQTTSPTTSPTKLPTPTPTPIPFPTLNEVDNGLHILTEIQNAISVTHTNTPTTPTNTPSTPTNTPTPHTNTPTHPEPLAFHLSHSLIKINELFQTKPLAVDTFTMNNHPITIRLNGDYDSLVKTVGLALNLILDSGDNYIFGPNKTIIAELVFLREITNLDIEFLLLPEIKVSQLIESYDILLPLINHIKIIENKEFQAYYKWYIKELNTSVAAAIQYQNSAKGIVDALSSHNIKNQETMTEQLAALNDDKLSNVLEFMSNMNSQNK